MSDTFDHRDDFERLFDQNFLRWFHLQGKPALLEITKVTREELTLPGGAKKKSPVIAVKQIQGSIESVKPLIGNKTNMVQLASFLGRKPSDWVGKQFVVFQDETKLKGVAVPCIRIREPQRPQPAKDAAK
jgi:hypothetical protein